MVPVFHIIAILRSCKSETITSIRSFLVLFLFIITLTIISAAGCTLAQNMAKPAQVRISTGGTAGTYYPLGQAMASIINDYTKGIEATAVVSEGSIANIGKIGDKQAEFALIQNDIAYYAQQGIYMFENQPAPNLSGIASLYPEVVQIVTLKEYGIKSLVDLNGKRVGVGAVGSGTAVNILQVFKAVGLDETNMAIQYLDFQECDYALKQGTIHAGCIVSGTPTSAVIDITSARDIAIVEIPGETRNQLITSFPFYLPAIIKAGTYIGIDEDVNTISVQAILATRADLSEDTVYEFTKAIFEHKEVLESAHQRGKDITLATALGGMSITLHPGAQRYFVARELPIP
ncbi:TAXI family TRAP transporter solute-binding subunit [Chloroflexota bacterium]